MAQGFCVSLRSIHCWEFPASFAHSIPCQSLRGKSAFNEVFPASLLIPARLQMSVGAMGWLCWHYDWYQGWYLTPPWCFGGMDVPQLQW